MNLAGLSFKPFELRLNSAFRTGSFVIESKRGFLIELRDSEGNVGLGSAEPFEYFGTESYDQCSAILGDINRKNNLLTFREFPAVLDFLDSALPDYPALHSGLEQAVISLLQKTAPENPLSFIHAKKNLIKVNALIGLDPLEVVLEKAENFLKSGFETIKIKCGRDKTISDLKVFLALRKTFGSDLKLRGDANGKWTKIQAVEILKALEDVDVEYIEQPVKDINDFEYLKSRVSTQLAADESMRGLQDLEHIISLGTADYVILKPIPAGGLRNAFKIIERAESAGIKTIVTTSMDSAIAKRVAVAAAGRLGHDMSCGLDTASFFYDDIAKDIYPVCNGAIEVSNLII